jgi:hypothetical protein
MSKLVVSPVKDTRIVSVRVEDIDAKRASLLANEVAEAYIAENLALRLRISESANRWLEERLGELEEKTKRSEIAVYDFKKDADMLTTSLEDRASIVSQRLNTYNGALTDVRTRVAGLKARVDALEGLRSGKSPEATPAYVLGTGGAQGPLVTLKTRYLTRKATAQPFQSDTFRVTPSSPPACNESPKPRPTWRGRRGGHPGSSARPDRGARTGEEPREAPGSDEGRGLRGE